VEHPSDELLSAYALDPILAVERTALEEHLACCDECRKRLAEIRAFDQQLANDLVWDEETGDERADERADELRRIAGQTAREDVEAEVLLKDLLDGPPEAFVWANLPEKSRYYTGGVVRRLSAAADSASYSAPLHALNVADAAIAISGMLSDAAYPAALLATWRGTAWKQRANALRHLGRFTAAFEALDRAEREYRFVPRPDFDLAAVTFIRATILNEQEDYDRARELVAESTRTFAHLGQSEMYCRARLLEGYIAFQQRDFAVTEAVFRQLYAYGEQTGSAVWLARGAQGLGNCSIEQGALNDATQLLHTSMRRFEDLGIVVEAIRCRWGIAIVTQRSGDLRRAVERFEAVREEFLRVDHPTDAALVTLDIMETFLTLRKPREVQRVAGNVVKIFADAGMLTGAFAAASYLRQAAAMQDVTPDLLHYLRGYFRRVEVQPDFAFAPPAA
jgi:tetratricopeptide (TPR) repeat protein